MSNKYEYHRQLDGLRCIAVLGPMTAHWMLHTRVDKIPLAYGVYLFYVLSGFLITNILLHQREQIIAGKSGIGRSYKIFIIRRTLRIFPIYYMVILVFLLLKSDVVKENLIWLLTYSLNIKIFLTDKWPSYISHIWTLAVEEQFYIFFPLVIFLVKENWLRVVLITIILTALVSKVIHYIVLPDAVNSAVGFPIHSWDSLGLGALLSYYSTYNPGKVKQLFANKTLWIILFISFIVLTWFYYTRFDVFPVNNFVTRCLHSFLFSVLCVYLVGVAGTVGYKGWFGRVLNNNIAVFIGKISYGIYLYHNFVPTLLNVFEIKTGIPIPHSPFTPLLYFVVTMAISTASWMIFESPINSLRHKFRY